MKWFSSYRPVLFPLLSILAILVLGETASGLRICSYSLQTFNIQKASNYRVVHTLTRVVYRCDICLLMDVVDPDGKVVKTLLSAINRESHRYNNYTYMSVSGKGLGNPVGRKQKYVFVYRTETVNVTDQYQYETKPANFVREPFAVKVQSRKTKIKTFILVPLHADGGRAIQEIDRLYDVFQKVIKKWNNRNVMFLGNFHAACAHMTRHDKKKIRLFSNSSFSWLIGDKVDTTVSEDTNCAYDRIVVYGKAFLKSIVPFSAKVYDFGKELKLSRMKMMEVSDHLPVEVTLKSAALLLQATPLLLLLIVHSFL